MDHTREGERRKEGISSFWEVMRGSKMPSANIMLKTSQTMKGFIYEITLETAILNIYLVANCKSPNQFLRIFITHIQKRHHFTKRQFTPFTILDRTISWQLPSIIGSGHKPKSLKRAWMWFLFLTIMGMGTSRPSLPLGTI